MLASKDYFWLLLGEGVGKASSVLLLGSSEKSTRPLQYLLSQDEYAAGWA